MLTLPLTRAYRKLVGCIPVAGSPAPPPEVLRSGPQVMFKSGARGLSQLGLGLLVGADGGCTRPMWARVEYERARWPAGSWSKPSWRDGTAPPPAAFDPLLGGAAPCGR